VKGPEDRPVFSNEEIIRKMKGLPDGRGVRLPIRGAEMETIGFLLGFDRFFLGDGELIKSMARAHTAFKDYFRTRFDVTPENKKNWLENFVLNNDKKMLFLVAAADGRVVGQEGFTVTDGGAFELDGTMRWGRGGHKDLFTRSAFERAAICFFLLGLEKLKVEVFKKNAIVIDIVSALGPTEKREKRLARSERGGVITFREASGVSGADEIIVEFTLDKKTFAAANERLAENPCWEGIF
jgi:hypothetical protein